VARGQQRLDDVISCLPIHSGEHVYRCMAMEESDCMKTRPELPRRESWAVTLTPQTWTELSPEEARAHILAGNSCLITGPAGSGKSTLVANIIKELRAERPVALISKTHVASQNMQTALDKALSEDAEGAARGSEVSEATTADAWTRRHVIHGTYAGAIWLDEFSTLDMQQYCLLNALTFNSCQFIVSGDSNQMGACFSSFRGIPVDSDEICQSEFFIGYVGDTSAD
jgi:superfamily I DNA/RNA helicase